MRFIFLLLFPLVVFAEDSAPLESSLATGNQSAPAEASTGSTDKKLSRVPEEELNRRSAALAALRSGREADAKAQLEQLTVSTAGNPAKSFTLATDFLRLAFKARSMGDPVAADRAAKLAWDQLAVAEKEFGKAPHRMAMIQSVRATLLEEFLGTEDEALGYYQKVIELEPTNMGAREKLERSARLRSAGEGLDQQVVPSAEPAQNQTTETR
jgi:tetratricopeptide (TPR) repeat protein